MASIRFDRTVKDLSTNVYLLYIVLFIAVFNLIGYLGVNDFNSVIIFILLGFLTQFFTNNMIIILLVPVLLTAFISSLNISLLEHTQMREGFNNKRKKEEEEEEEEDVIDNNATKKMFNNMLNAEGESGNIDINGLTKNTSALISKQKKLRQTMNDILPLAQQTSEFMNKLDMDKLAKVLGNFESFT